MDFDLTEEQKLIQTTTRDFVRTELESIEANLDQDGNCISLLANLKKLASLGFMGINVKKEYGGAEAGAVALSVAMIEIAKVCATTAAMVSVNNRVCEVIQAIGTEEQKTTYIPKICSGEFPVCSFALPGNGAGSDPSGMETMAVKDGENYILNGSKICVTSAPCAEIFVVGAVTDQEVPKNKGTRCFLVKARTPGLTIDKKGHKMGQSVSAAHELILDNCRVPASAMMGKLNDDFLSIRRSDC